MSDPKKALEAAIKETEEWITKGWPVGFGPDQRPVNSVKDAEALPKDFVYSLDAKAYWRRIKVVASEALEWGRKALAAVEKGNLHEARDCAYYALFIERGFREKVPTWGPAIQALRAADKQTA